MIDGHAYQLLYESIYDYKNTAVILESEIKRVGLRSDSDDIVTGIRGRRRHSIMWASMKGVSHFNLAIALELMLKLLLLAYTDCDIPKHHRLAELFKLLPDKQKELLRVVYGNCQRNFPEGYHLIAIKSSHAQNPPPAPEYAPLSTLEEMLSYFDTDVRLETKRYAWELLDREQWIQYLSDTSMFSEFIAYVMRHIPTAEAVPVRKAKTP